MHRSNKSLFAHDEASCMAATLAKLPELLPRKD